METRQKGRCVVTRRTSLWWRPWPLLPARIILEEATAVALWHEAQRGERETLERGALLIGLARCQNFHGIRVVLHEELEQAGVICGRGAIRRGSDWDKYLEIDLDKLENKARKTMRTNERALFVHSHPVSKYALEAYPSLTDKKVAKARGRADIIISKVQNHFLAIGYTGHRYIPVVARGKILLPVDRRTRIKMVVEIQKSVRNGARFSFL